MQPRIAFATCVEIPDLTPDDRLAASRCEELGLEVAAVSWDDPAADWSGYAAVILRSCWDYHLRVDAFRAWFARLRTAGCAVWNPLSLVEWNLDKRYLLDLAERGVAIVPTVVCDGGTVQSLEQLRAHWQAEAGLVVKPVHGASAHGVWLATGAEPRAEQERLQREVADVPLLVQPLQESVCAAGETSLIYFDGRFSHAVRKLPAAGRFEAQEHLGGTVAPLEVPADRVAWGEAILDTLPTRPLYARVDLVPARGSEGDLLMELELCEPSLYLDLDRDAPGRFARTIFAAVAGGRRD